MSFHRTARFATTDGPVIRLTLGQAVSKGEQVLISYGCRSSEDFVCYYGFCPHENPHDSVVVDVGGREFEITSDVKVWGQRWRCLSLLSPAAPSPRDTSPPCTGPGAGSGSGL